MDTFSSVEEPYNYIIALLLIVVGLFFVIYLVKALIEGDHNRLHKLKIVNLYLSLIIIFYGVTSLTALNDGDLAFYISLVLLIILAFLSYKVRKVPHEIISNQIKPFPVAVKIVLFVLGSIGASIIYVGEVIKQL